ncbi:ATP-grasp domain-containing protein [Amycolatopsis regifaucium]|uniref:ATP-grasp domain-containing protein n=1 Tax=Amycolatopsis regifaucium TaxID=546365 RepID=A0A154MW54_9PSEU|nr:hypothetical protein [Amycolatopsis regifaucium]KZB87987.1 hypothetical protein AVL48_18525 [Amycolatopsis regifaucium]OKA04507.1 hypothetical protein ATP06_0231985 [Amycolatopsis regifaucium]SFH50934.1 hypothetical protein SAMN04489731_104538 [Amycolatopsis regifaucium]
MDIALVTSSAFPGKDWSDRDTPLLQASLEEQGCGTRILSWDDCPGVDWTAFDVVAVQSPWSMWLKLGQFREWVDSLHRQGVRLANPHPIIVGGMSKEYLPLVEECGARTIPTTLVRPGDRIGTIAAETIDRAERDFGERAVVVKPISSGGTLGAARVTEERDLVAKLAAFEQAGVTACVQPYISSIDTLGEHGIIMIDGEFSHAITKDAILAAGRAGTQFHPNARAGYAEHGEDLADIDAAYEAYLKTVPVEPMSVRLDFLRHPATGRLLLLEIESVAPVKFFHLNPAAAARYARSLIAVAAEQHLVRP